MKNNSLLLIKRHKKKVDISIRVSFKISPTDFFFFTGRLFTYKTHFPFSKSSYREYISSSLSFTCSEIPCQTPDFHFLLIFQLYLLWVFCYTNTTLYSTTNITFMYWHFKYLWLLSNIMKFRAKVGPWNTELAISKTKHFLDNENCLQGWLLLTCWHFQLYPAIILNRHKHVFPRQTERNGKSLSVLVIFDVCTFKNVRLDKI